MSIRQSNERQLASKHTTIARLESNLDDARQTVETIKQSIARLREEARMLEERAKLTSAKYKLIKDAKGARLYELVSSRWVLRAKCAPSDAYRYQLWTAGTTMIPERWRYEDILSRIQGLAKEQCITKTTGEQK